MNIDDFEEIFEKYEDEYIKFDRVENKLSRRPDLHAFLLLDRLQPTGSESDMISGAEHDEIYLDVDCDKLAEVITEEQLLELIRCGIRYEDGSFCMFV